MSVKPNVEIPIIVDGVQKTAKIVTVEYNANGLGPYKVPRIVGDPIAITGDVLALAPTLATVENDELTFSKDVLAPDGSFRYRWLSITFLQQVV